MLFIAKSVSTFELKKKIIYALLIVIAMPPHSSKNQPVI